MDWEGLSDFHLGEHTSLTSAIAILGGIIAIALFCWLVARKNQRKEEARTRLLQLYVTKKISYEELERGLENLNKRRKPDKEV